METLKINNELKARFFAQYFHQLVFRNKHWVESEPNESVSTYILSTQTEFQDGYLSLKPLSSITDEDAIEVAKIFYPQFDDYRNSKEDKIEIGKRIAHRTFELGKDFNWSDVIIESTDWMRSKGYALPYMGISVEHQIEIGWLKLID